MDLKAARFEAKRTQWHLRILTGIHQSTLSLIENGYISPDMGEKQRIAEALGMQVSDIDWPKPEVCHAD